MNGSVDDRARGRLVCLPPDSEVGRRRGLWIREPSCVRPKGVFAAKKTLRLEAVPRRAVVHVAADSRYAFFVNGIFAGRGPVRGTHRLTFHDTYDITPLLSPGENTLALAVMVFGQAFFVYVVGQPGVWLEGEIEVGGVTECVATDGAWRVKPLKAYDDRATLYTFQAGWSEWYRADLEEDWTGPSTKGWRKPETLTLDEALAGRELRPRMIGPMADTLWTPRSAPRATLAPPPPPELMDDYGKLMDVEPVLPAPEGLLTGAEGAAAVWPLVIHPPADRQCARLLFDIGRLEAGHLEFEIEGPPGAIMDIGYNEALVEGRLPTAHGELGKGYRFADRYVLGQGRRRYVSLFAFRAARFIQIVLRQFGAPVTLHSLGLRSGVAQAERRGRFCCSDLMLDKVYEAASMTLRLCMWDTYMDCPWREQAMWVGDMFAESLYESVTLGGYAMSRQCLEMASHGMTDEGYLRSVYPSEATRNIPSFSLLWVMSVDNYVRFSGDASLLAPVFETVVRIMETFDRQRAENGLLNEIEGAWQFYDWGWKTFEGQNAIPSLLCFGALNAAARLARRLGRAAVAQVWEARAQELAAAVNRVLWSDQTRSYHDGVLPDGRLADRRSQHVNALAVSLGLAPADRLAGALDALERGGQDVILADPFYHHFVLDALGRGGRLTKAIEVVRQRFQPMLSSATGTIWETWTGKISRGDANCWSLCHAFSCGMLWLFPAYILGVTPLEDGWRRFRVAPATGGLEFAQGTLPTPWGGIQVSWMDGPEQFALSLIIPPAVTEAELALPYAGETTVKDETGRPLRAWSRLKSGHYTAFVKKT
ncbi:MAG TPA: family 78 glycoside hydrolase catalytic domain [Candidatus Brocadiia bacterium]|nr:family 78 glycoside hydrolase catalytic domain [Candidatus Brocadiia bacterium]